MLPACLPPPLKLLPTLLLSAALTLTPAQAQVLPPANDLPTLGEAAADDLSPANERRLGESIMRQVVRDPQY
ncbi:MAG: M48 family peptidase, partial [Betaproteobacteria bacterium]